MSKSALVILAAVVAVSVTAIGCTARPVKETTEEKKEIRRTEISGGETMLTLKSSGFQNNETMPVKYANRGVTGGKNLSVPLVWENPPEGTKSFAVAIVDRHPVARNWIHWLVINIPAEVNSLPEGASNTSQIPPGSVERFNTGGTRGYGGPQPPPGSGVHDYEVTLYALDKEKLDLPEKVSLETFTRAVEESALASAKLVGKFSR